MAKIEPWPVQARFGVLSLDINFACVRRLLHADELREVVQRERDFRLAGMAERAGAALMERVQLIRRDQPAAGRGDKRTGHLARPDRGDVHRWQVGGTVVVDQHDTL